MVVNGIITILAPLAGGLALSVATWRSIFTILTIVALIILIGVASQLPKTSKDELKQVNFSSVIKDFGSLLKKPAFIIPMLLQGLTYVMLFSYSSASPFITQKLYNMTPQQFSIMFAVNGVGLIIVSQVVALLVEKLHRHIFNHFNYYTSGRCCFNYPDTYIPFTTLGLTHRILLKCVSCRTSIGPLGFANGYGRTNRWQW